MSGTLVLNNDVVDEVVDLNNLQQGDDFSDEEDYDIERPSLIEIFYETGNQEVLKLYKQINFKQMLILMNFFL